MWNRVLGKLNNTESQPSSSRSQHKDDSQPSKSRRSDSLRTSESSRGASKGERQSQDFTPTSQNPSAAFKTIVPASLRDVGDPTNDSSAPPEVMRNTDLVDQMPNLRRKHNERYADKDSSRIPGTQNNDFSKKEGKRSKTDRREDLSREEHGHEKQERRKDGDKGRRDRLKRGPDTFDVAYEGTSRGAGSFPEQTGGSSSVRVLGSQSRDGPDENNGGPRPSSSLVQDQFPGQFPSQASAPYRPPLASSEGGPGLAAEYYGDAGQSVADQPGFRKNSPSLIVGAEPHLQAASAVAAPPLEPSAIGGVGAAASFYSDSFDAGPATDAHHPNSQPLSAAPTQTAYSSSNGHDPSSTFAAGAAAGAAAGYFAASQPLDHSYHGNNPSQISSHGEFPVGANNYSQNLGSYGSLSTTNGVPSKPHEHSSQSTNIPLAVAGAAGLAAAAYHHGHNHHGSSSSSSSGSSTTHQYFGSSMAQRHHHRGPLSKLVDFFKDPEGVAQFEEYTEYIGVCKYCFAPGSSPRDAPRKHHYRRRRSFERFGNSSRIDKDSRYWSSEGEGRRRSQKSWIEKGLAGYGLAKVTRSLFDQNSSSDDTYRIQSGRTRRSQSRGSIHSADRKSHTSRGVTGRSSEKRLRTRSRSTEKIGIGVASGGNADHRNSGGDSSVRVHQDSTKPQTRSPSWSHKSGIADAALGAATGSLLINSGSPKYNRPTEKVITTSDQRSRERSPHRTPFLGSENKGPVSRHGSQRTPSSSHKEAYREKKKSGGFFTFGNESSSSSGLDVSSGFGNKRRKDDKRKSRTKLKTSDDANAALVGLGAAATALALSQNQKPKHSGNSITLREAKGKSNRSSRHGDKGKYSPSSDEDLWESASEGEYSSTDLDLAYGATVRRSQSGESLSSASSGLDKWDWRWASKKEKRPSRIGSSLPASGNRNARNGREQDGISSNGSAPLQHVYPISTSDPSRFDVVRNELEASSHMPLIHSRPEPVPIQHPQPVAPVSSVVYTPRATYEHSNSAPTRPSVDTNYPIYPYAPDKSYTHTMGSNEPTPVTSSGLPLDLIPITEASEQDRRTRRSDSSPLVHSPGINDQATRASKRTSTRDDNSSVRFDLTKEQKNNHRREERRRQKKEEEERRLQKEPSQIETQSQIERESRSSDQRRTRESAHSPDFENEMRTADSKKESWTTPVAAGAVAATIGGIIGEDIAREQNNNDDLRHRGRGKGEYDVNVIVHERHASPERIDTVDKPESSQSSQEKKEAVSLWQAAAKIRRSSSHENYAAYFIPPELLSNNGEARQTINANADNDIVTYQIPEVIPIEPRERNDYSQTHIHSIGVGGAKTGDNSFPWPVPTLTISEPTPPTSRSGSVIGGYSPLNSSRDPTVPDLKEVNIPTEPLEPLEPLTPLESTVAPEVSWEDTGAVEYTIIEPKERRRESFDSSPSEINAIETTPGISSLKYRSTRDRSSSDHGDDIEFAATVAAGLQDSGFDPSIVIDDPSFPRRDSPPGSQEGQRSRSPPTGFVTEISSHTPDAEETPRNKVSYEEPSERHMPGSFGADHEGEGIQGLTFDRSEREEDNSIAKPGSPGKPSTEPADNATIKPKTYLAEPEPLEPENTRDIAIDPYSVENVNLDDEINRQHPGVELPRNVDDNYEYVPNNASTGAPTPASFEKDLPPKKKKSKRRSSGFEDTTSMASASAASENVVSSQFQTKEDRKGSLFGLFGKKSEVLPEGNEARETPTEATLEDFEEPKQKRKKSKGRKSTQDGSELSSKLTKRAKENEEDPWSNPKEVQSGEVKPYDRGDAMRTESGRMTQDLPAESNPLAALESGLGPQSNDVLTNLEDQVPASNIEKLGSEDGRTAAFVSPSENILQSPSFLEMRPETPPSPDIKPSQHDPGGTALPGPFMDRESSLPDSPLPSAKPKPLLKSSFEPSQTDGDAPVLALQEKEVSPTARADTQKWRLSDIQSESRQNPFTSPSPTAVPLRPFRFGRSPSSPGLSKSTTSTPLVPSSVDPPFTPRKRERPHSTEFKSNEFRPMWLLEKHGSRQEFAPQETYPSLPSSHSTSRSSSMHEADDLDQIRQYSMAISDRGDVPQLKERGLYIDTSQHAVDSELLDSQQATPTAASFHSSRRQDPPSQPGNESTEVPEWRLTSEQEEIPRNTAPAEERLRSSSETFPQLQVSSLQRRKSETSKDRPYLRKRRLSSPIRSSSQAKSTESVARGTVFNTIIAIPAVSAPKLSNKYDQTLEWSPDRPGAELDSIANRTVSQPSSLGNDKMNSEETQVPHERAGLEDTGRSLYPDEFLSQSEEKPTKSLQETARIQIADILDSPITNEDKLPTLSDSKPTDTTKAIDSHEQLVDQTVDQVTLGEPSTTLNQPDRLPPDTKNNETLEDINTTRQPLETAADIFPQDQREEILSISSLEEEKGIDDNKKTRPFEENSRESLPPEYPYDYRLSERSDTFDGKSMSEDTQDAEGTEIHGEIGNHPVRHTIPDGASETEANQHRQTLNTESGYNDRSIEGPERVKSGIFDDSLPIDSAIRSQDSNLKSNNLDTSLSPENIPLPMGEDFDLNDTTPESLYIATNTTRNTDYNLLNNDGTQISVTAPKDEATSAVQTSNVAPEVSLNSLSADGQFLERDPPPRESIAEAIEEPFAKEAENIEYSIFRTEKEPENDNESQKLNIGNDSEPKSPRTESPKPVSLEASRDSDLAKSQAHNESSISADGLKVGTTSVQQEHPDTQQASVEKSGSISADTDFLRDFTIPIEDPGQDGWPKSSSKKEQKEGQSELPKVSPSPTWTKIRNDRTTDDEPQLASTSTVRDVQGTLNKISSEQQQGGFDEGRFSNDDSNPPPDSVQETLAPTEGQITEHIQSTLLGEEKLTPLPRPHMKSGLEMHAQSAEDLVGEHEKASISGDEQVRRPVESSVLAAGAAYAAQPLIETRELSGSSLETIDEYTPVLQQDSAKISKNDIENDEGIRDSQKNQKKKKKKQKQRRENEEDINSEVFLSVVPAPTQTTDAQEIVDESPTSSNILQVSSNPPENKDIHVTECETAAQDLQNRQVEAAGISSIISHDSNNKPDPSVIAEEQLPSELKETETATPDPAKHDQVFKMKLSGPSLLLADDESTQVNAGVKEPESSLSQQAELADVQGEPELKATVRKKDKKRSKKSKGVTIEDDEELTVTPEQELETSPARASVQGDVISQIPIKASDETSPIMPEDLEVMLKSKKDKKKAKRAKVKSLENEDKPVVESTTEAVPENPNSRPEERGKEDKATIEPQVDFSTKFFETSRKSKKEKKKGKKAGTFPWEDESYTLTVDRSLQEVPQDLTETTPEPISQLNEAQAVPPIKKSIKSLQATEDWSNEDETSKTKYTEENSASQDVITKAESNSASTKNTIENDLTTQESSKKGFIDLSKGIADGPPIRASDDPDQDRQISEPISSSKKGKKKAKKAKAVGVEAMPAPGAPEHTSFQDADASNEDVLTTPMERVNLPEEAKQNEDTEKYPVMSKKEKKKAKKAKKAFTWEDDPLSTGTDAEDTKLDSKAQEESIVEPAFTGNSQLDLPDPKLSTGFESTNVVGKGSVLPEEFAPVPALQSRQDESAPVMSEFPPVNLSTQESDKPALGPIDLDNKASLESKEGKEERTAKIIETASRTDALSAADSLGRSRELQPERELKSKLIEGSEEISDHLSQPSQDIIAPARAQGEDDFSNERKSSIERSMEDTNKELLVGERETAENDDPTVWAVGSNEPETNAGKETPLSSVAEGLPPEDTLSPSKGPLRALSDVVAHRAGIESVEMAAGASEHVTATDSSHEGARPQVKEANVPGMIALSNDLQEVPGFERTAEVSTPPLETSSIDQKSQEQPLVMDQRLTEAHEQETFEKVLESQDKALESHATKYLKNDTYPIQSPQLDRHDDIEIIGGYPKSTSHAVDVSASPIEPLTSTKSGDATPSDDRPFSVTATKKSRKGKKSKKPQPVRHELQQATETKISELPSESSAGQSTPIDQAYEQIPSSRPSELTPGIDDVESAGGRPTEPPPIAEVQEDYFGSISPRHGSSMPEDPKMVQRQDENDESYEKVKNIGSSNVHKSLSRDSQLKTDDTIVSSQPPEVQEEAVSVEKEPIQVEARSKSDKTEDSNPKKSKKAKRKQKSRAIEDVMWEFPAMKDPEPHLSAGEIESKDENGPQSLKPPTTQSYGPEMLDAGESHDDKGKGTSQVLEKSPERALVKDKSYSEPAEPKSAEELNPEDSFEDSLEAQKEIERYETSGKDTLEFENQSSVRPDQEASVNKDPLPTSQYPTPGNTELAAAAAIVGAAEALRHRGQKKEKRDKKGKKAEKRGARSQEAEAKIDEPTSRTNDDAITDNMANSTGLEPSTLREAKMQQHKTPPSSPEPASHAYSTQEERNVPNEDQRSSKSANRDSAVHVADSPRYGEKSPTYRYVRDSGYPETEASMLSDFEPEPLTGVPNQRLKAVSQSEDHAIDSQIITPRHADPARADQLEGPLGVRQDSGYSMLKGGRERRHSSSSSQRETTHDDFLHEDGVDKPAGFHARTLSEHDMREPSLVSSTTKDRSSVLFHSSPSTREVTGEEQKQAPPQKDVFRPTSKAEGSTVPAQNPALDTSKTVDPEMVAARAESLTTLSGLKEASQTPRPSLFGGPIGVSSDVTSPPLSPLDPQSSDRRRLNTITEYSPEESPLNKKARHLSDVGSPDRGVKSARRSETPQSISKRRERSPPTEGPGRGMISTDALIARLSWPPVDEEKHSIDLERSRSRGAERRLSGHHSQTKPHDGERRSVSGTSDQSVESINAIIKTPDQVRSASGMSNRSSGTPPLRRADRSVSGDLRGASKEAARKRAKQSRAEVEGEAGNAAIAIPSSSTYDPVKDKGKGRVREMADVYVRTLHNYDETTKMMILTRSLSQEGYGDFHGSPLSPTRPPSMRRRQSMQVLELESKLDQLTSENRLLQDAKSRVERNLEDATHDRSQEVSSYREGLETRDLWLHQKDTELNQLKQMLEGLQSQVSQLTEVNENLRTATRGLDDHEQKYSQLEADNAHALQQWQLSARELEELRQQHSQLSAGMEDIVRHEVAVALEERNMELRHVRDELEVAREQVRALQAQILASKRSDDFIVDRDEDYFDSQCQALCQHVQQWVLRFSKFSDMRACYLANEVKDEKVIDRMENAILDGSDFDIYLADRVKRRDVFMSVVMTMIWEFIFTRYLFGMDREQRQKLKALEKTLSEVGPMSAVHKWRATTLNLLTKRESFAMQRAQDTEAVMHTIYETLATFLPPPPHLVMQIQSSLLKVLSAAVDLSIEMRTQRAEYIMLPPLQPEYDTNGDLARKVYFNAALMNERSGMTSSNEALEQQQAVVRMVLFPLVVKKGDDAGQGTEKIVVCPAQVLVAPSAKDKKTVRVMSAQGERSEAGSDVGMGNMF